MRTVYGLPTRSVALGPAGLILLILLVLLVLADPAAAQFTPQPRGDVPDDVLARGQGTIDDINRVDTAFQAAVTGIGGKLAKIARNLLLGLLLIEMVWTLGQTVMRGGDFGRITSEYFQRIVIFGCFLLLIDGFPTPVGDYIGIAGIILSSAETLSDTTIESSIKPAAVFGDIFKAGAQIFYGTQGMFSRWAAALVWLALIFVGAIIAGILLVIYIEIYVAFTVGNELSASVARQLAQLRTLTAAQTEQTSLFQARWMADRDAEEAERREGQRRAEEIDRRRGAPRELIGSFSKRR